MLGMAHGVMPGVAPGMAHGATPGVAPGVAHGLTPGVAHGVAHGATPGVTLPARLARPHAAPGAGVGAGVHADAAGGRPVAPSHAVAVAHAAFLGLGARAPPSCQLPAALQGATEAAAAAVAACLAACSAARSAGLQGAAEAVAAVVCSVAAQSEGAASGAKVAAAAVAVAPASRAPRGHLPLVIDRRPPSQLSCAVGCFEQPSLDPRSVWQLAMPLRQTAPRQGRAESPAGAAARLLALHAAPRRLRGCMAARGRAAADRCHAGVQIPVPPGAAAAAVAAEAAEAVARGA
eukprot:353794-Chlamydomonas_euryale.AAC.13